MGISVHFLHRNIRDIMIIVDVNLPHPQCPCCDMLLLWALLNGCHPNTTQCTKGVEWKCHRMAVKEMQESTERDFREYGYPLNSVP